jgi:para-nitrobenzyl esterase
MMRASLLAAGLLIATSVNAVPEPVRLDSGLLGGGVASSEGVRAYKGIPFAAPPVGALRWAAPAPVAKWDGTRDASKFGNVCIQPPGPTQGPQARLNIAVLPDSPPMAEDCLYLNVWTGAQSPTERRPVMVYFFGGAFTEGAGSVPLYDGDALARKGAVVVTMNYRLGPYGFFVHPALTADSPHKASGNWPRGHARVAALSRATSRRRRPEQRDRVRSPPAMAIASLVASPEAKGFPARDRTKRRVDGSAVGRNVYARARGGRRQGYGRRRTTIEQLRAMSAADDREVCSAA